MSDPLIRESAALDFVRVDRRPGQRILWLLAFSATIVTAWHHAAFLLVVNAAFLCLWTYLLAREALEGPADA